MIKCSFYHLLNTRWIYVKIHLESKKKKFIIPIENWCEDRLSISVNVRFTKPKCWILYTRNGSKFINAELKWRSVGDYGCFNSASVGVYQSSKAGCWKNFSPKLTDLTHAHHYPHVRSAKLSYMLVGCSLLGQFSTKYCCIGWRFDLFILCKVLGYAWIGLVGLGGKSHTKPNLLGREIFQLKSIDDQWPP